MLGIGKLAAGAEDYYLAITQGIEDYYVGIEAPGQWIGSSNRLLGLDGEVDSDVLRAVFDGRNPTDDTALITAANRRVVAFDLSYKADKTVSLLHAWGGPDVAGSVEAAHSRAVASSLAYLEDAAVFTRRGRNGVNQLPGDGLVAARFRHYRNRNDEPHLHDHVLVPNMVRTADGRWSTIDARHLYTHSKTAGYVYQAVLRHELSMNLGVEFGPVHNGVAPIAGIPRPVVEAFSTRRAEIIEHLEAVGASSAKAAQIATLQTRRAKDAAPDVAALQGEWDARARAIGFEPTSVANVIGPGRNIELTAGERANAEDAMLGPTGLTAHATTFDKRDVIRAWCEAMPHGAPHAELQLLSAQTIARAEVVALDDGRRTTKDLLAVEQRIVDQAVAGIGAHIGVGNDHALAAAFESRPTISKEQADLARRLVTGGDGVAVVVAPAGTGKGFVLGVAREAWEASGHRVIGTALAARAAGELRAGAGIESMTVAQAMQQIDAGHRMHAKDVLVVDEAGMVGTRQLARLVDYAVQAKAKVVLVGDPRQLPEIDAGGVLGGLAKKVPVLTLSENRRQVEEWEKAALGHLRSGSVEQALEQYEAHGRITWSPRLAEVRVQVVDAWASSRQSGEDAIMLASRREDVRALNKLVRESGVAELSGPSLAVGNDEFRVGDTVMTLRNDRRLGVRNGDRGVVLNIDTDARSLHVQLRDRELILTAAYLEAGHVTYGYAMTVHKAQGLTCDRSFVLGTDDLYREMGYVAMSRGRLGNHLFAVGERSLEVEPAHAPTVELDADELVVSALRTSRAQTMASTRLAVENPLAALSDKALGDEHRQIRAQINRIPRDVSPQVEKLATHLAGLEAELMQLENQREAALQIRRPTRDALAGRDRRTVAIHRAIGAKQRWIDQAVEKLAPLREQQRRHDELEAAAVPLRPRLAALDAEIDRRAELKVAASLNNPPGYVIARLGRIPAGGEAREAWLEGAETIERFRLSHGVTDEAHALGRQEVDRYERSPVEVELDSIADEIDPPVRSSGRGIRR